MIRELIEMFLLKKKDKDYDSYRDQRIYIRVTQDEKDIIKKLAKCQCLDTSNFVRWLIFSRYIDDFVK